MGGEEREYEEIDVEKEQLESTRNRGPNGFGGELFGPPTPGPRYRCPNHGLVMARDVVWRRDGNPYCNICGRPLAREDEA